MPRPTGVRENYTFLIFRTSSGRSPNLSSFSYPARQTPARQGFLERLEKGPVVGDGGFFFALEKRGYVDMKSWTPEYSVEYSEAVKQLHREFVKAGADICQAFTSSGGQKDVVAVNEEACKIAKGIAYPAGGLVAGCICETSLYLPDKKKELVKDQVKKQLEVFKDQEVDLIICEYYEHVEEAEWHVEAVKEFWPEVPVCASLSINEDTDVHGVPTGACGVKLAAAGADVVGINCHFDPFRCLAATKKMIKAVKDAGYDKVHFMTQPIAYMTPDASIHGYMDLPEFPLALEPRICTRFEMQKYAREAFDAGIRFIGGCCGFEPYHIRAISEELVKERDWEPTFPIRWGKFLEKHTKPWVRARANKEYWQNLNPGTGRPYSASLSTPDH